MTVEWHPSTVAAAGLLLFLAWLTFTFFTS